MVKFGGRLRPTWPSGHANSAWLPAHPSGCSQPATVNARGLMAWSSIGHETAGHDILSADTGLKQEVTDVVQESTAAV
jgi:hypothetical protein